MEEITSDSIEKPVRPQFLSVLCVLSYIGSGLGILACIIMLFFGEKLKEISLQNSPEMDEEAMANLEVFDNMSFWTVSLILVLVSLYGVIKMYNLKKIGFHLYASANIVALALPLIFGTQFSTGGLVITAGFIAMYAANLKYMS